MDAHLIYCTEYHNLQRTVLKVLLKKFNKERMDSHVHIIFFENNMELFNNIREIEHEEDERIPDMFILDINTPKMTGLELLSKIRNIPIFNKVPIIMHTTVPIATYPDILTLGANAFLNKSGKEGAFIKTIDYWLNCHKKYCEVPGQPKPRII